LLTVSSADYKYDNLHYLGNVYYHKKYEGRGDGCRPYIVDDVKADRALTVGLSNLLRGNTPVLGVVSALGTLFFVDANG